MKSLDSTIFVHLRHGKQATLQGQRPPTQEGGVKKTFPTVVEKTKKFKQLSRKFFKGLRKREISHLTCRVSFLPFVRPLHQFKGTTMLDCIITLTVAAITTVLLIK